jgi:hypothetical protein
MTDRDHVRLERDGEIVAVPDHVRQRRDIEAVVPLAFGTQLADGSKQPPLPGLAIAEGLTLEVVMD